MGIKNKLTYRSTIVACYIAQIISAAVNNLPSLLFVTFQESFGISTAQLASLITLNFGTQIAVDLIGAKYVDKIGYRQTAVISGFFSTTGLASLGILPMILPNAYLGLCIASLVFAVGSGLNEVVTSPMVEALPGKAKEATMSILHSFYCWGHVGVVLLSTLYLTTASEKLWYILPVIWSVLPLFNTIFLSVVPIKTLNENTSSMPIRKLFTQRLFWVFFLLMLCGGAAEQAMAQWASLFAESALGVTKAVGNLLGPCFFAVMMGLSRVIYAKFSLKLPLARAIFLCAVITLLGYLVTALISNPYVSLIGCGIIGFGVGIFWPGTLSLSSKSLPAGGTAMFGFLALAGDIGCFTGPSLAAGVSKIIGSDFSRIGLLACIVFPIVIAVPTFFMAVKASKRKKLEKQLKKHFKNQRRIEVFDEIASTNTYLKNLSEKKDKQICIALSQTGGRGRGDKSFLSFGEGLYMSALYIPEEGMKSDIATQVTCSAAVAVCESIRELTGLDAKIKWVNDIYIGDKKVCGILTEGKADDSGFFEYFVLGIGVNIRTNDVPSEIEQIACALYGENDKIPEGFTSKLCTDIICRFEKLYKSVSVAELLEKYRALSMLYGKEVFVSSNLGLKQATVLDICDDFSLEVRYLSGKTERLNSGEVSLKLLS